MGEEESVNPPSRDKLLYTVYLEVCYRMSTREEAMGKIYQGYHMQAPVVTLLYDM